jgi:hypothetical protein
MSIPLLALPFDHNVFEILVGSHGLVQSKLHTTRKLVLKFALKKRDVTIPMVIDFHLINTIPLDFI